MDTIYWTVRHELLSTQYFAIDCTHELCIHIHIFNLRLSTVDIKIPVGTSCAGISLQRAVECTSEIGNYFFLSKYRQSRLPCIDLADERERPGN